MSQPLTNLGLYGDFSICDKDIISGLNANFQLLDNLVQLAFNGIVAELPEDPVEGDKYILSTDDSINLWNGTEWIMYPAQEGYIGYNKGDGLIYFFDGDEWVPVPAYTISFDNTGTGLTSTNLQDAIEELKIIIDGVTAPSAISVTYNNATSGLVATNVQDAIDEVVQDIDDDIMPRLVPTGTILMWSASSTPSNYLPCDGSAVSRATYSSLFSLIGTTYGVGDGSTTFNIPNFQGLVPRGVGSQVVNTRTKTGPSLGAVQEDQMQRITGSLDSRSGNNTQNAPSNFDTSNVSGAFSKTNIGSGLVGAATTTNFPRAAFGFDSATSPGARASSTTNGETRVSSIGINFIIKT